MTKRNLILILTPLTAILIVEVYRIVDQKDRTKCLMNVADYRGLDYNDAKQIAESQGLDLIVIDSLQTNNALSGTILEQTLATGTQISEGLTIKVKIEKNKNYKKDSIQH